MHSRSVQSPDAFNGVLVTNFTFLSTTSPAIDLVSKLGTPLGTRDFRNGLGENATPLICVPFFCEYNRNTPFSIPRVEIITLKAWLLMSEQKWQRSDSLRERSIPRYILFSGAGIPRKVRKRTRKRTGKGSIESRIFPRMI